MKPFLAFTVPFSLLLLVSLNHARKDPAGDYWKMVMKDQPLPEAVKDLMVHPESRSVSIPFVKDFDIRPNVIIYHTHADHEDGKSSHPREPKSGLNDVSSAEDTNTALKVPDHDQKTERD